MLRWQAQIGVIVIITVGSAVFIAKNYNFNENVAIPIDPYVGLEVDDVDPSNGTDINRPFDEEQAREALLQLMSESGYAQPDIELVRRAIPMAIVRKGGYEAISAVAEGKYHRIYRIGLFEINPFRWKFQTGRGVTPQRHGEFYMVGDGYVLKAKFVD